MVKKIISYSSPDPAGINTVQCQQQTGSVFGDWRNLVTFVGDDQDGNIHVSNADVLATNVKLNYPFITLTRFTWMHTNRNPHPVDSVIRMHARPS